MTNRDKVLLALSSSLQPLDDDEIARRAGFSQRQTANMICRALEQDGVLCREPGPTGKIVNRLLARGPEGQVPQPSPTGDADAAPIPGERPDPNLAAGSSLEQRDAERHLLAALSAQLGKNLTPRRLAHPSGARVELDGADQHLTILVECWAHQGPAKVAQKYKLVNDAVKLSWIARSITPPPERLIICVSDPAAVQHLHGASWQRAAIRDLGVELVVVELPPQVVDAVKAAQTRQYR